MDLGTPTATKVVGGLSLLAVAALGWTLVVGPETSTLSERREQVDATRAQNQLLATQLASLEQQREELGSTRRIAAALAEQFPPTADQPGLFEAVTAAAVEAGIGADGVTTLSPTPPTIGSTTDPAAPVDPAADTSTATAGQLARQTVTVSITGSYDQTQQLLENLEQMPRAYLVRTVNLAGDPLTGIYTTTVAGDMFVMPPVADPAKTLNLAASTVQSEG
ncbi:hypothetical protein [Nocardioides sp. SR21]|uniref:hypothetical protein n=1 Tax=Nocardioides sp. SR21 TaxID=2919501 RepID=UPI001FA99F9D|nr:hypothetical protein [Nocardioides sp. SR21]